MTALSASLPSGEIPLFPRLDICATTSDLCETHDVSRLRVLVVDDDASVCEVVKELLTPTGCEVVPIADTDEAIAKLRAKETFHVLILDLKMPSMDGLTFLRAVRKFDQEIAVIILTGFPSLQTATDAIEYDVSAYMQKPFATEDLRATVDRVARKKGIIVRPEDELHVTIGQRIRLCRKTQNLTLKQLGRRTGLSVSLLSQIERAESSASISSLYKISNALDLRLAELFGEF